MVQPHRPHPHAILRYLIATLQTDFQSNGVAQPESWLQTTTSSNAEVEVVTYSIKKLSLLRCDASKQAKRKSELQRRKKIGLPHAPEGAFHQTKTLLSLIAKGEDFIVKCKLFAAGHCFTCCAIETVRPNGPVVSDYSTSGITNVLVTITSN
jgi:hypothetical protein